MGAAEFRERGHAALSAGNCDIAEHLNGAVKPYDVVAFMTVALPDEVAAGAFDFERARTSINGHDHFLFMDVEQKPPVEAISTFLASVFESVVRLEEAEGRHGLLRR